METLKKKAKTMDMVVNFISKIAIIAAVLMVVLNIIMVVGYKMGLDFDTTTKGISIEGVDFELVQPVEMSPKDALIEVTVITIAAGIAMSYVYYLLHVLRRIIKPMKEGTPFASTVSNDIRRLGNVIAFGGIVLQMFKNVILYFEYTMLKYVMNDSFAHVSADFELIDTSCVFVGILVIMLSYVFRYGEELQQQADETL